jgi:hypothetical protein
MTFDPASQVSKSDVRTSMADLSSTGIAETGEVQIAGHRYVTAERLARMLNVTESPSQSRSGRGGRVPPMPTLPTGNRTVLPSREVHHG